MPTDPQTPPKGLDKSYLVAEIGGHEPATGPLTGEDPLPRRASAGASVGTQGGGTPLFDPRQFVTNLAGAVVLGLVVGFLSFYQAAQRQGVETRKDLERIEEKVDSIARFIELAHPRRGVTRLPPPDRE